MYLETNTTHNVILCLQRGRAQSFFNYFFYHFSVILAESKVKPIKKKKKNQKHKINIFIL